MTELKGEIDKSVIITGNFKTHLKNDKIRQKMDKGTIN